MDNICASMLEDITREKTLVGDLSREDCDEDNSHKFLCLSKIRQTTKVDGMK